ncbi:MAG: restriction endonuclease subunit S [Methylotetracoccus sp.]
MAAFPTVKLADCVDLLAGFAFKSQHFTDRPDDIPLVKGENVSQGCILWEISKRWSASDLPALEKFQLRSGDVVVAMDRPWVPAGLKWAYIRHDDPKALLVQRCARLRSKTPRLDQDFLRFVIGGPGFESYVIPITTGVNVPHISGKQILDYEFLLPPISIQQRIAGILSAYDELIENCQRRIQILEAMARALYREWFVHFRFPGHESASRVASPLGSIPKGWEITNLDSVKAEQPHAINGGPFGSKLVSKDYVASGVPVIRGSNLSESGRFDPTEFVFVSDEKAYELRANLAKPGDIVVTQRGTLGQIGMIPSGIGYDRFVISQSQMKITLNPKKVNREYAFFFLRSEEANQRIKNLASSSGVPHINLAVLRDFNILVPPFGLQSQFGQFAVSTEAMIEVLLQKIQNLRRTRNLLLPRLLSGQINVEAIPEGAAA